MESLKCAAALALRLAVVALLVSPPAGAEAPDHRDDLEALRGAIDESRERVGAIERSERALLERLEEVDRSLTLLAPRVHATRRQADAAAADSRAAQARAETAAARLQSTRAAVSKRVRALYKAGEVGPLRMLFSAGSLREILSRASLLRAVVRADADLAARHRGRRDASRVASRAAQAAAQRSRAAAAELSEREAALGGERRAKRSLLTHVRADRAQERALLMELERAAHALEETLAALGATPQRAGEPHSGAGLAARVGRLPPPVAAPIRQHFGRVVDAEFLTETFRKGVEFAAAEGVSVRAVAAGEVRFAGWFRGYGQIVILDHGDGYFSVYGHLGQVLVEVGQTVGEADTLGSAGETGSLSGPSLYFELRRGSEPLDPAEWLRPTARG